MRKREFVFGALLAAVLSVGTAKTAHAVAANCWEDCASAYGEQFYAPYWFWDDAGNLGSPGGYQLIGCDDQWCYYYGGGES